MGQFDYINNYYGTDYKRGDLIKMDGKPGKITGADGAHIMVRFEGVKHSRPCHPTWEIEKGDKSCPN